MTLEAGTRLGPYEIERLLGVGGMGEVYRARDSRLGRDVAVKVLPARFAADGEMRERFEREARTISQLTHPNICSIFDVGSHEGTAYLVMELLEGESLAERIAKGPLLLAQALRIGRDVSAALAAAHRKGIVHRDVKPANIFLSASGTKLLDFGLAKLRERVEAGEMSQLPTEQASPLTGAGSVLGTLSYMAPEQLEGKPADARTDLFALGSVLYEMVTGKRPFSGDSSTAVMTAILTSEPPPVSELRDLSPPMLDRLVRTCLSKYPDERWQSAADLGRELEWIADGGSQAALPAPVLGRKPKRERLAWAAAALLGLGLAASLLLHLRQPARGGGMRRATKLSVLPPEKTAFQSGSVALSPDGTRLAFVAAGPDGRNVLWIRPLDSLEARPLPGTERAFSPFWSPDGRFLAFSSEGKLRKIEVSGGPPQIVCDARSTRGGTWNRDGVILFAPYPTDGLYRVSAAGCQPVPVTKLDPSRQENSHRWPTFLPDGRHFLYFARSAQKENRAIYIGSLDSKETTRLMNGNSNVLFAPSTGGDSEGYLLFERDGWLAARRFDTRRLEFTGEPLSISPRVKGTDPLRAATFTVSDTGVLAYGAGAMVDLRQLVWADRSGKPLGAVGPPGLYIGFTLSPDEKRVALDLVNLEAGGREIWLMDLARSVTSRLTLASAAELSPVWSPDGSHIAFATSRGPGGTDLFQRPSSGAGIAEPLLKSNLRELPSDWSRDGQFLLYEAIGGNAKSEIWVLPLSGERKPAPVVQGPFNASLGIFSPDGRWIAYVSDESGRQEVYVQTFPVSTAKWRISPEGGSQPRWRRDGKEIFFLTSDGLLMAAAVTAGVRFEAASARPLFRTDTMSLDVAVSGIQYAVASDAQRFLVSSSIGGQTPQPITVVLDWTAALEKER